MNKPGEIKAISRTSAVLLPACVFLLCILVSAGCIEKMELPSDIDTDDVEFSAGDTTYLLLSPVWDESYGFQTPIEISIAQDGHIFVADSAAHSIFVLEQDGDFVPKLQDLRNISVDDSTISPIDVDIDKKMNVFFIDGSQKIYCWNQYWNDGGVDSVVKNGTFLHIGSGDSIIVGADTDDWKYKVNSSEWNLIQTEWTVDTIVIDSLLKPHIFFDGRNNNHNYADWKNTEKSQFSGISGLQDGSNFIYTTDIYYDRIIKIVFFKTYYLKLSTGEEVWVHEGHFGESIKGNGTGAGYVNQPLSIDVDYEGNIYYSQLGDFYNLHQIQPNTEGVWATYSFADEWEGNAIMDTIRFPIFSASGSRPEDIAVDQNQMVYVANSNAQEIQVFNSHGGFFKKAGVESATIDSLTWESWDVQGTDTLLIDTLFTEIGEFYKVEIKGTLEKPRAVTVDSRGVIYICDTPSSSIFRYRLSNQLDEDLNPIP